MERRYTRSAARKRHFTMGNMYEERKRDVSTRRAFKTVCKTLEFQTRLNLHSVAFDILGMENKWISIEVGYSSIVFECVYQYREISSKKNPICRLVQGWNRVVDFMSIQQGDTIYFEGDVADPNRLQVSLDKHDTAIKIEPGIWI